MIDLNVNHVRYSIIPLLRYIYKFKSKKYLVFNHELSVLLVILRFLLKLKINIVSRNISVLSIKIKQLKSGNFWLKYFVGPLIKYFYHKIDHVINQCNNMREDLISIYPQLINNSSIIYNPISKHIIDYVNKYDLNKIEKNYLLCVGRLEQVKSFHYAIEGFAGIANKFPDLRLKIVGKRKFRKRT